MTTGCKTSKLSVLMTAVAVALAACGGSAAPSTGSQAPPASTTQATAKPSASGREQFQNTDRAEKPAAEKPRAATSPAPAAPSSPASAASPAPGAAVAAPAGIYVYSEHLDQDAQQLSQSLGVPGVDGLTLLQGWASIEPDKGSFDWAGLDQWMNAAAAAGKKVVLAIRAGQDTPCWLFMSGCPQGGKSYAGATPLNFQVSPREGFGQSKCNQVTIAAPWDPVFLSEWDSLLSSLSAHLKSTGTYSSLVSVRLTGIDRTTSELRLPSEILTSPCQTNSLDTWTKANPPFRPSTLLGAWDKVTDSFLNSFPDKFFGAELIPTASGTDNLEYPFPAIDEQGCVYQPPWPASGSSGAPCINKGPVPDQNAPLLALANQKFAGRLSLSYQNLDVSQPASPYVVQTVQSLGTKIGFQTNDYDHLQRAACSGGSQKPGACDANGYLKLLEVGIYPLGKSSPLKAMYIEVLPPDAIAFPSAIQQAHAELTS